METYSTRWPLHLPTLGKPRVGPVELQWSRLTGAHTWCNLSTQLCTLPRLTKLVGHETWLHLRFCAQLCKPAFMVFQPMRSLGTGYIFGNTPGIWIMMRDVTVPYSSHSSSHTIHAGCGPPECWSSACERYSQSIALSVRRRMLWSISHVTCLQSTIANPVYPWYFIHLWFNLSSHVSSSWSITRHVFSRFEPRSRTCHTIHTIAYQ